VARRVTALDAFTDARGVIRDLITNEQIDAVTLIYTKKKAVRGNHYHHETTQWTFVVSGKLRVVTELLPEQPEEDVLSVGQLMVSPPDERHAWKALEDTVVLVFTQGPRSGANYESDVVRLEAKLIE
jgi:quercetin dioxygenase-like cupin family protein